MGLDKSLDEVRGRILGTKPLPSLREAFSKVRREESCKRVMMGQSILAAPEAPSLAPVKDTQSNSSALVARSHSRNANDN